MLGRLIQGYSRGGQLESATDETHTRTLLWPEISPDTRYGSLSPPTTPFGSPNVRVSPFDDRIGLDLNQSTDLRIIIAQDAFGTHDRPLLLYDTTTAESISDAALPTRQHASPFANDATSRPEHSPPVTGHMRNRSSTISGSTASWARPNKESEPTDHLSNILDCMFGVTSATKSGSSTKIHVLPGDRTATNAPTARTPTSNVPNATAVRAPLLRAKTSINAATTHRQSVAPAGSEVEGRDSILITRIFPVTLPETKDDLRQHRSSSAGQSDVASPTVHARELPEGQATQGKKPKLVEKKTPVYAIGLLFYISRSSDNRPGTSSTRPASRASFNGASAPASYGSDASWTFLNAIPEHLLSPEATGQLTDRSMDIIVRNWDVILRSLTVVEQAAHVEIGDLLQEMNLAMISSAAKAPKGPAEQRTNQRNVYLRCPNLLAQTAHMHPLMKHALWRISYALRIPRVLTGFGLDNGGHWLDEARYLVRLCGNKQQNFFLFNVLTAFLGNHTEWLERLGPDWYRKQIKARNKAQTPSSSLASRTVIICDNRSTTRRLIFLLASFLPPSVGSSAPLKAGAESMVPILTPDINSSSAANKMIKEASTRRHIRSKSREGSMAFPFREVSSLSTSASSTDSYGAIRRGFLRSSRSVLSRADTESVANKPPSVFTPDGRSSMQKTTATSSTATPGTSTPVPHFSTKTDSYFPDAAVVDAEETSASAGLGRILRRDSVSNSQAGQSSINWGSLISNVSGLWGKGSSSSSSMNQVPTPITAGSLRDRRMHAPRYVPIQTRRPTHIEKMVDEASNLRENIAEGQGARAILSTRQPSAIAGEAHPPRLRVDEKDGVVDVDITLPGFVGWTDGKYPSPGSSLRVRSPSVASIDEAGSFLSLRSNGTESTNSSPLNVAGYLKRYHEDFILQGVKPYQELEEEVRQSMSRELTNSEELRGSLPEEQDGELWVNVCTTLFADCRTYTIRRLTLQRRVNQDAPVDKNVSRSTAKSDNIPPKSGTLRYRKAPVFQDNDGERFLSETVMDFDTTLTDAIERVLYEAEPLKHTSGTPSRAHLRTVSTASSMRSEPLEISNPGKARNGTRAPILPRSDCRQAVVGALEEVVKSVNNDLAKHHRSKDGNGNLKVDGKALEQDMKQDNVLREGVKKWLLNVETRSVW